MDFELRNWKEDDIESLVKHADNFNVARYMTDAFSHPYTRETGLSFIAFANKDNPVHIFAIDVNKNAVGGIGIHPQNDILRKNAELGYWLAEPYWGKGIMTNAVTQMIHFAFANYDIQRIFARPFGNNGASQKVLQKAGFKFENKFEKTIFKNGEYLDELFYAIRRHDFEAR